MRTHEQINNGSASATALKIRTATVADGATIWRLARDCDVLDTNSCYAYLLICRAFAETTLVAAVSDEIVGFVTAFVPPARPDVIFVWQVGVAPAGRKQGIAKKLLHAIIRVPACRRVKYLEATITPSNAPSRRLFRAVANELQAEFQVAPGFRSEDFGSAEHEPEELIRIGPFQEKA